MEGIRDYFIQMVKIDSESRNERAFMDWLKQELAGMGAKCEEDNAHLKTGGNAGNLYAYLPGKIDKPPLLLCAHVDTVKPGNGIKPVIKDGRIYSDGTTVLGADDKSGVAEMLWGIKRYLQSGQSHAPLELLFTISEEVGLLGAKHFDKSKLTSALGYAFDSQDIGEFMIAAPAQNTIKLTIHGKEAHAGVEPEKGINAIRIAAEAIAAVPIGRIDFETTANIGIIQGGTATNVVPNKVEIAGEARSHNPEKLAQVTRDIISTFEHAIARHKLDNCAARLEVKAETEYQSFCMQENHPVVQLARQAVANLGFSEKFIKGGGGSDANIIIASGVPMIVAGTGMYRYHTVEEYIDISDLEKGADLVCELIRLYSAQ